MGVKDLAQEIGVLEPKTEQEVRKKAIKATSGSPLCYEVIEWNRSTRNMFYRGQKPKQGRRYCLQCMRFDGKRAYFILRPI